MSELPELPEDLQVLVDDYVSGVIDEARLRQLETRLCADAEALRHFVRYCRMHTDLQLESLANRAGHRALHAIEQLNHAGGNGRDHLPGHGWMQRFPLWSRWSMAAAAVLLAAFGSWVWLANRAESPVQGTEIAWLINAQDCQWADGQAPAGDMRAGKMLHLQRGLAEIHFQVGAQVVLEGPANLELLTGNSARLVDGKLTAKVPPSAKGFQITSPHGKVVDLGTEFAMSVSLDGTAEVYVFAGKVEAYGKAVPNTQPAPVNVLEKQSARIDAGGVALKPTGPMVEPNQFIRAIVPAPRIVPRIFSLDFRQFVADTLLDSTGLGVGLTHRLPGTGKKLKKNDDNLRLETDEGRLAVTTTNSDLNTSRGLDLGEYLGIRLADHGFTGTEDFAVTVVVPNIPELPRVGQFGLYAGPHSKKSIRGGMISSKQPGQYNQFLVQNNNGKDYLPHYVGVSLAGDDVRLTLRRAGNNYSLEVENLTTGNSTTITMRQPEFLKDEGDFYVGFFGANTQSKEQRTLMLKEFKVTVWTVVTPPS